MDIKSFAEYLIALRANAGKPPYRELEKRTQYSDSTISAAFQGRALPTWPVTEAIVRALGADVEEARKRWAAAGGGSTSAVPLPDWVVRIPSHVPKLVTGLGMVQAVQLAVTEPYAAIDDGWEVVRLSGVQLAGVLYKDLPGHWTSNIVASFRRAEDDGRLPNGVSTLAACLQSLQVSMRIPPYPAITPEAAVQYVVLAYRLAHLVNVTLYGPSDDPPIGVSPQVPPPPFPSFPAGGPAPFER
ncbi:helix-turn-helix domain-containing protein [Streptomyces luteireticuli]|uniref:helix-turn-helix domain-containing protein n=1 Tax=Streptomyces luteireticuli TaxID=173858 RepID=UPI003558C877